MRHLTVAALATLALAGCGKDSPSPEQARKDAGKTFCGHLQKAGALLEPMSRCLAEYDKATREPKPVKLAPSHFFDRP